MKNWVCRLVSFLPKELFRKLVRSGLMRHLASIYGLPTSTDNVLFGIWHRSAILGEAWRAIKKALDKRIFRKVIFVLFKQEIDWANFSNFTSQHLLRPTHPSSTQNSDFANSATSIIRSIWSFPICIRNTNSKLLHSLSVFGHCFNRKCHVLFKPPKSTSMKFRIVQRAPFGWLNPRRTEPHMFEPQTIWVDGVPHGSEICFGFGPWTQLPFRCRWIDASTNGMAFVLATQTIRCCHSIASCHWIFRQASAWSVINSVQIHSLGEHVFAKVGGDAPPTARCHLMLNSDHELF